MLATTKTVYGGLLASFTRLGKQYVPPVNSTLNEIHNIHVNAAIQTNDRFADTYIAIGRGGHRYITAGDGEQYPKELPHKGTDGSLYKGLPWIVRPINADLSGSDRAKYGMRVPITVASVKYWAYYLKKLDLTNTVPQMKITTYTDGVPTDSAFVPDNTTLTPQQPEMSNTGVIATDGRYVTTTAIVTVTMDDAEITEFLAAVELVTGKPELAIISEIALVSAVVKSCPLLDQNRAEVQGQSYWEAVKATVTGYVAADFNAYANREHFGLTLDMGTSEPMFGTSQLTVQSGS